MEIDRPIVDAIHDSGSSHRTGQPARLTRRRTPIRSAISRSFARLAAEEAPTKRSPRSFSIPCCQRWALKPSHSKIPASSSEIEAFPWRKSRPVYSTSSRDFPEFLEAVLEPLLTRNRQVLSRFWEGEAPAELHSPTARQKARPPVRDLGLLKHVIKFRL